MNVANNSTNKRRLNQAFRQYVVRRERDIQTIARMSDGSNIEHLRFAQTAPMRKLLAVYRAAFWDEFMEEMNTPLGVRYGFREPEPSTIHEAAKDTAQSAAAPAFALAWGSWDDRGNFVPGVQEEEPRREFCAKD